MLDLTKITAPANISVEQALLGAILIDNAVIDRIAGIIQPEDFCDSVHANVFALCQSMRRDDIEASPITLRQHVERFPDIGNLPVWKYLVRLATEAPSIAGAKGYAEAIRDYSARRKLFDAGYEMIEASTNPNVPVSQTASLAVQSLDHVLSIARTKSRAPMTFREAAEDYINSIATDDGADRIPTGSDDLDKAIGGWRRKQLIILGGRPSMGKTTIANSLMLRTAKAGHGVLMFSLEMPTRSLMARCLSDLSWSPGRKLPYSDALAGRHQEIDIYFLAETAKSLRSLPFIIDDQRGITMAEIAARTRAAAQKMERDGIKLGLVIVDHLGLVKPTGRYAGNKVQEVGEISDALATLAKEQDVAVLALHQLNRATEGRENKRPGMADLRNSGDIEQDADVILFAYRESYYLERMKCDAGSQAEVQRQTALDGCRNTLELQIAKARNGEPRTLTLYCDMSCNVIRDLG